MLRVVQRKLSDDSIDKYVLRRQLDFDDDFTVVDCTSHNIDKTLKEGLSPFYIGPVDCYDGLSAKNLENAWQFSKVYPMFFKDNKVTPDYFSWRDRGWQDNRAHRHPMGRGIPLFSYWEEDGRELRLGYVDARKKIYLPLYAKTVVKTSGFRKLKEMYENEKNLVLADFDGYNNFKLRTPMSYADVLNCSTKRMGHAFVLAMLLEGLVVVKDGTVDMSNLYKDRKEIEFDIMSL